MWRNQWFTGGDRWCGGGSVLRVVMVSEEKEGAYRWLWLLWNSSVYKW